MIFELSRGVERTSPVGAMQTASGLVSYRPDLDLAGLDVTATRTDGAFSVKDEHCTVELRSQKDSLDRINSDLPRELEVERGNLAEAHSRRSDGGHHGQTANGCEE
jgi:GTP-dependent phosphoenolpyruvate carboxykinase